MSLLAHKSLKKIFLQIVLFGAFVPFCFSILFLYYLIKINKEKLLASNNDELHRTEFSIQNSLTKIADSLQKIEKSDEIKIFLNSKYSNQFSESKKLHESFQREKNLLKNQELSFCLYGTQNNLIYSEPFCPKYNQTISSIPTIFESHNFFILSIPYVFRNSNDTILLTLSAVSPIDAIKTNYPFLESVKLISDDFHKIKVQANLKQTSFEQKIVFGFYATILFCAFMIVLSMIYGLRVIYLLKNKTEDALKLAAVGKIAHLLAHDIQKPFDNISNFSSSLALCQNKQDIENLINQTHQSIQTSQSFIKNLLNELMDADSKSLSQHNAIVLNEIFETCFDALGKNKLENIQLTKLLTHTLPLYGDETKLTRAFLNIISNAVDALQNITDGKIQIKSLDYAKNIRIIFYNSHSFLSKHEIENIFDPFYTTKNSGTGLGLAITKKMVELHGGTIMCHSKKKDGVYFIVDLPSAPSRDLKLSSRDLIARSTDMSPRGLATGSNEGSTYIFLIDDCALTLRAWTRQLKIQAPGANIQTFLKFEDFFHFIESYQITEKHIATVICDYLFKNSSLNIRDALQKLRKFYSKRIYIASNMNTSFIKDDLKRFNILVISKNLTQISKLDL